MTAKTRLTRAVPKAVVTLAVALLLGAGSAMAQVRYLGDGAVPNSRGGWDLPKQGSCPTDVTKTTRPDCLALRIVAADSATCTGAGILGAWTTSGVCNDLVNNTQALCQAAPDRFWNAGTGVCAIVMKGDDRNNVVCAKHGGNWVTTGTCVGAWVMPLPEDSAYGTNAYGSGLLTGTRGSPAGTGDACLRCHNATTQYNGPRVRDTQNTMMQGHKNMSRPVRVGMPWGGPPFSCTGHPAETSEEACVDAGGTWDPEIYHSDDQNHVFDWAQGKIAVGAASYALKWIYGDWLAALPRAIYADAALANMSYSCGRCHTTGWTSDPGTTPLSKKEPENTFPGITWNGTGTNGQVKLGGGVAGDTNVMSSWDVWGISCSRCHNSAVDSTAGTLPMSAAPGMSSHHNLLTGADNNSGVCTDTRFTGAGAAASFEANCTANGGTFLTACSVNPTADVCTVAANTSVKCAAVAGATWVATPAGWCSNAFYTTSANCTANGYAWQDGWCSTADAKAACTGGTGDGVKTWRLNGTPQSCQVAGATWSYSKCNVEGYCNKGTNVTSKAACDALTGQFAYATDIVRCIDAGGHWTGNNTNRGQIITKLCMDCHRQETTGLPNTNGSCSVAGKTTPGACVAAGGTWTEVGGDPLPIQVGMWHETVTYPSHPHSNQMLNSPHGKFTGKFTQIATGKFNYAMTGEYKSHFMADGEAANTGNGCTGCHEVHTSVVAGERPFREECTECHTKSLNLIQHPSGIGTPLEKMATEPFEACVSCHMPGAAHLFRINVDQAYSTFPIPAAFTAPVAPNTAADGTFTKAVWVDLDAACGQCHGGGTSTKATTGSIAAGATVLTVADSAGFTANEKIRIAGAGGYYYDDIGHSDKYYDFDTYIKTVDSPTQITLAGKATKAVTNAAVVQNAVKNGGAYISKVALAGYAKGIHNDKPYVSFTAVYGANGATVNVDAGASKCSGSAANCNAYSWTWGDGSPNGSGVTASHTYAPLVPSQDFIITLTVTQYSVGPGEATQKFTAYPVVNRPTAAGNCVLDYTAWTATCTNTGTTPDAGYQQLVFDWGDGTVVNSVLAAPWNAPVVHKFLVPGNYKIKLRTIDTLGQEGRATLATTVSTSFVYSAISGTVFATGGVTPLGAAQIQVKLNGSLVKSTMTAANGTYSLTIKPGTYTVGASKSGHTFPAATSATVPPAATVNITAN